MIDRRSGGGARPRLSVSLPQAHRRHTTVRLTIVREGEDKPLELTLVREMMRLHSVRSRQDGGDIGYIRMRLNLRRDDASLGEGDQRTVEPDPCRQAQGYVLDLRNTPGGMIDTAVSIADAFLDEGEIVSVRGRNQSRGKSHRHRSVAFGTLPSGNLAIAFHTACPAIDAN
jgi:C-terminal processing protease CtpA/Prc